MKTYILPILSLVAFCSTSNANEYYLDAKIGNDYTGDGSIDSPWQSLSKAQEMGVGGDTFFLATGEYAVYSEQNISRNAYITYQGIAGSQVIIKGVDIQNSSLSNTYLKFIDIKFLPDDVLQTHDPQDPNSTQATYNKTKIPIILTNVNYFEVLNSKITGRNRWYTTELVYATSSQNLLFEKVEANTAWHAFRFVNGGTNITVRECSITNLVGTAINTVGVDYSNMLYERNYIYETDIYPYTEDYAPKATGSDVHGSCISVRDGNTTIRNNILRRCGSSSGIMFYEDDAGNDYVNENILVENNLIYDTPALHPLRIYELGKNVIIRNNTIIGETYTSGTYAFRTGLLFQGIDDQKGTPSLELYNNIIIGITSVKSAYTIESNNIFWSYQVDGSWRCNSDLPTSHVFTCGSSGVSVVDPLSQMKQLFPNEPDLTFDDQHGTVLNFSINKNSLASNFGDMNLKSTTSLGPIYNNFITHEPLRSEFMHSAGAFEENIPFIISISNN